MILKHYFFVAILFFIGTVQAQFQIPAISGMKDSLVHPAFGDAYYSSAYYINIYTPNEPSLSYSQNVGDFDGDGSDDIFIRWSIVVNYYDKMGNKNDKNSRYHFGIFSYTKNKYLFTEISPNINGDNVICGDFNNDDKIDFVFGSKIYFGTNSLSKKKVLP